MNKKFLISLLSLLVLSSTLAMADETTTTTRPEPPQGVNTNFENGTPPDFVKGQGINTDNNIGNPPRDFSGGQKGQFDGRRPSKKPDKKPDGDRKPPEWDNASDNGQGFQGKQPPQFDKNGRPPKPQTESDTNTTNE